MESEIEYNELLGNLLIKITIIIPEKRMPKDLEKCMEIIMNKINVFQNFYDAQNEIYKRKNMKSN